MVWKLALLVSYLLVPNFLEKLRKQPEHIRKLILWIIIIIIGLGLSIWWIHSSYWKIKKFPKEEFIENIKLPDFEKELPKMEMPEFPEEELEKLREEIEKSEEKSE